MNLMNLLSTSYWFSQPDPAVGLVKWFWVLGFLALVLAGLVLRILLVKKDKITKQVFARISNIGFMTGMSGMIWMFFRQESVFFLAWRFWIILITLVFVIGLVKILKYILTRVPEIKKENEKRLEMKKYMPR